MKKCPIFTALHAYWFGRTTTETPSIITQLWKLTINVRSLLILRSCIGLVTKSNDCQSIYLCGFIESESSVPQQLLPSIPYYFVPPSMLPMLLFWGHWLQLVSLTLMHLSLKNHHWKQNRSWRSVKDTSSCTAHNFFIGLQSMLFVL